MTNGTSRKRSTIILKNNWIDGGETDVSSAIFNDSRHGSFDLSQVKKEVGKEELVEEKKMIHENLRPSLI